MSIGLPQSAAVMIVLTVTALAAAARAQTAGPPLVSPQVEADRRVTFRFRAPSAREVLLAVEGTERRPMSRDDQGVWSLTTPALAPDFYGYTFVADEVGLLDPLNPLMKPNLLNPTSMVHVPGPTSGKDTLPWDVADVPRGQLHRHFYRSGVAGDHRDYHVYTPPGYNARATATYPVLYLLHGFSDDASGWTAVGQAHVIMDNLIAQRHAHPMIVVMPLGYGAPEIVSRGPRSPDVWRRNIERFREALLTEVLPAVERDYRVDARREQRAIAGLSMGGAQSLFVGLNTLDTFAWIGAFSSGGLGQPGDLPGLFPGLDASANGKLKLLYIACGTEDRLIEANRQARAWLTSQGVTHEDVDTAGAHTWMVWRRNLAAFALRLFATRKVS